LDILVQRGYDENCLQIYESMKEFRRRPEFWGVKFGTSVNRIEMERCQVSILRINLMLEKNSKRAMHGGSTKTDTKQTKAALKVSCSCAAATILSILVDMHGILTNSIYKSIFIAARFFLLKTSSKTSQFTFVQKQY
jgi:hypothetical protein